jgi:HSP20 family protein
MLTALWKDFDRFDRASGFFSDALSEKAFSPSYDVQDTKDAFILSFDVPGIDKENLGIELEGATLFVSGERKVSGKGVRHGRFGKFRLEFTLPEGVKADDLTAAHLNGVLTLTVKKPVAAQPTKIAIGIGAQEQLKAAN